MSVFTKATTAIKRCLRQQQLFSAFTKRHFSAWCRDHVTTFEEIKRQSAAASKIGKFLPGSRIPIVSPDVISELSPDYVVILPWNIADEVKAQFPDLVKQGSKFITFVPELREI